MLALVTLFNFTSTISDLMEASLAYSQAGNLEGSLGYEFVISQPLPIKLLLGSILLFALLYFTLLYFTLLYFTLLYFTLLYFTLLYFTLLYLTYKKDVQLFSLLDYNNLVRVTEV